MKYTVSKGDLCTYLVQYHSLNSYDNLTGEAGVLQLFQQIGSVQYDPLNIVGRNPDLVLQSRIKGYTADILDKLLYKDRLLVDGWDKEMSIYSTSDWPYFQRIRACDERYMNRMFTEGDNADVLSFIQDLLDILNARGPLGSKDIELGNCVPNRWGHKKVASAILDYLFFTGRVGVFAKKNAIKTYDLIENLLPHDVINAPDPFTSEKDFLQWYFLRRIGSIGLHWQKGGLGWNGYYLFDGKIRAEMLKHLEAIGAIIPLTIPEIKESLYICATDIDKLHKKPEYDGSIRLLAPLDNMLWDRLMVQKLFDFQYTWEVYVPAEKRKYGYYVLPVLYQNRLIARMEPAKAEIGKPLVIKNWWWESEVTINTKVKQAVKRGLQTFSSYLKAEGVDISSQQMIYKQ